MKLRSLTITIFCACLLSIAPAYAQTVTGTINGTVTDTTGAVIPNVEVVANNTETGATRSAKTNAEGFYNLPFLPLGSYHVTAKATGFTNTKRENIQVTLNQTLAVNFALQASAANANATITAEPAPINTTNAEIKQSLGAQQIVDRPVANQGNFLTLAET
ncbi:MAG: carboxypeptidase regulatory-like domain-containing protein, partial [Acidobacteria bacterium]|nr:carboxypeptidase regulatory-like domain-containing protein [Acidobacteriota bacterium]